jgi:S-DNA-T family DNA segregation ATPase FtsK/SpoIIIE
VDAERANADDPEPQTDAQIEQGKTAEAEQPETAPAENEPRRPKQPAVPIVNFPSPQQTARAEPYPRQIENWVLPSLELLQEPEYSFTAKQEVVVRGQAKVLERTLEEFRIDGRVVEIDTGPVITMFELKLGAGIKVSQIASLSNDIARALKAHAIRVVAPISGKNTVGIEVPNVEKEIVRFKEVMTLAGRRASKMSLPLFLGKDAGGAALVADLASMPHLLIAGTTGSGKSVCINTLIVSLLMTKRPDHVKMILIDPKMVELSQFKEVPHLMCPIVTDLARAEKILEWAVTTMDERYALLAEARVKNVAEYNSLGADQIYERLDPATDGERARISTHLPHIVIMIDELADLMMTSAKEVEHHLSRLAQKSRAVGVHIIVATQRPEAKVVTGLVKSNLPCRICFRVASRMDSRIVLDRNGGEVLMGAGDMLFLPPGLHKLIRAQGTFLQESEVRAVLDDLASRAQPEFHPELMRIKMPGADGAAESRDPLFDDAVRIILESKRGSVSLLQRRLTIGYSRASRLIDQMADAGIVGAYKGSQAREVQMSLEEWEALAAQVAADREAGYEADQDDETAADPAYTILSDSSERASSNDPK